MKLEAARRLLAEKQVTDPPNNNKDMTWQKKQEDKYKGKNEPAGHGLPEGTFKSDNPGDIVNKLKQHSDDYGQASKRLNNYINRSGKNLDTGTKDTLYRTKDALRDAYGEKDPKEKVKPVEKQPNQSESETTAAGGPQCIPRWHIGNQPFLNTGFDWMEEDEQPSKMGAATRLLKTSQ